MAETMLTLFETCLKFFSSFWKSKLQFECCMKNECNHRAIYLQTYILGFCMCKPNHIGNVHF